MRIKQTGLLSRILNTSVLCGVLMTTTLSGTIYRPTKTPSTYLHTSGSKILDSSNNVVGLSGLNWFGFETANNVPHGLWTRSLGDMLDQIKSLGYNVIRLPFSNAMLKPRVMPNGIDYTKNPDLKNLTSIEVMDRIIAGAEMRGIKIILDNHRSTPGGGPESGGLWYAPGYSESDWIADWKMLTKRYRKSSAVIGMDLRNEPHGGCWGCGDPATDWRLAAEKAGNAILSVNPDLLILVEGVSTFEGQSIWWGGNLMGVQSFPVRLDVPNRLVYSPHEYPETVAPQSWFNEPSYPNNLPALWDKYWGYIAKQNIAPVLIGEFGTKQQTQKDQQWFQTLMTYAQQNGLNWTYWSLNPNSGDTGGLLADDWKSVNQGKQDVLKQIQFPFIGSGSAASPPSNRSLIEPPAQSAGQPQPAQPSIVDSVPAPTAIAPPNAALSSAPARAVASALILDDAESGNASRWSTFRDGTSNIGLEVVSPGADGNFATRVTYGLAPGGWGGIEQKFASPQDWSAYDQFSFRFYGGNTGNSIRLELFGDRMPGNSGDTSARFEYRFTDNFSGWQTFTLAWTEFIRRADWQPDGAPNNGLVLSQIWGYNFSPINGSGSFQIDQNQLLKLTPAASSAAATARLQLDNFEADGLSSWGVFHDANSRFDISLASPGQSGAHAIQFDANIGSNGWGGVGKYFTSPQNWTPYNNIDFWFYGNNTGSSLRLEILDNRQPGSTTDTSERFEYRFTDNWTGWQHFTINWLSFTRRADWQPEGAPNDGFTRSEIWGLNFAVISGAGQFRVDEISLTAP